MKAPLSHQFIVAFAAVILAAVLGVIGITFLALPIGLIAGFVLIREMVKQYFK
jgi:hypothetical protein